MVKGDLARENFKAGMNCAQAVLLAFKDDLKIDEQDLKKLIIGFGGGFARQRYVCGAVSGMTAVLGSLLSDGKDRLKIYQIVKEAMDEFSKEAGSVICAELLDGQTLQDKSIVPEERTEQYYKKRPCAELCALSGDIAEKLIKKYK
ncbi:MAG: C_GCAxxG_C_C family protein [Clostridia bacterium]|nr:C_GCAxxG_C_C family protein [Clostridia bacterium]